MYEGIEGFHTREGWQRVGALLLRLLHHALAHEPHKAWLYVDDLLLCLLRHKAPEQLALTVAFLTVIGAPISWKKAAFGDQLVWCGWKFCFATESICLAQPKLDKLRAQLLSLLEHKRVPRKELESCLGRLMWATSVSSHLRCFAAPLYYADLHSPPGTQYPIPPRSWPQFLWCPWWPRRCWTPRWPSETGESAADVAAALATALAGYTDTAGLNAQLAVRDARLDRHDAEILAPARCGALCDGGRAVGFRNEPAERHRCAQRSAGRSDHGRRHEPRQRPDVARTDHLGPAGGHQHD